VEQSVKAVGAGGAGGMERGRRRSADGDVIRVPGDPVWAERHDDIGRGALKQVQVHGDE
jgi:hypothetical protein